VAYFCTPDGDILHAVWGPATPQHFLDQATFAVELADKARNAPVEERADVVRAVHEERPYGKPIGLWYWETSDNRYSYLKEKVMELLDKNTAEELFLRLGHEKPSSDDVKVEATPSWPRRP
jgi:hypothetical protein